MKKFLVFLASIVVVVCFGLTTYYFMRNDEIININTKELYCNAGDIISLDALDIEVKKADKDTTFNYNAGGEEVTNLISYNEERSYYQVSQTAGGEVELVISTTNKKYPEFKVRVHVGNGSVENPYYVFSQIDLNKIGNLYRLDASYSLMNNISLSNDFMPIGYSEASSSYVGFSGNFYGNGYTISGLNLNSSEFENAGLFSSINSGATVSNLKINNATINGAYTTAGVLAGSIAGNVEKVVISNSSITNTSSDSYTGALAGVYTGSSLKLSYVENVALNIGSTVATVEAEEIEETEEVEGEETEEEVEEQPVQTISNVTVGGFVGKLIETSAIATYTNNTTINLTNANGNVGGYAGEFVINTNSGTIQQSYANVACTYSNFAGFIGKVSKVSGFNAEEANMLAHFIGNIAIVNGKADIADTDLVKIYDNSYFVNQVNASESVFYNPNSSLYLIRGFASAGEAVETNEYVYYAIDANNKTLWDTTYVWNLNSTSMPSLTLGGVEPTGVSGEYFRKDLTQVEVTEAGKGFKETFSSDVSDANIKLLEDVDLSSGWTPVSIYNCTIDGNGATITINLNKATNNKLGLFAIVNNCTIKNLNIVVTGVSANATEAGALAASISSSDKAISSIENVTITYLNTINNVTITNFGGVAGEIDAATISNSSVSGLVIGETATIKTVGAVVGEIVSGSVNNVTAQATIYGTSYVGGVAGINQGIISNVTAEVVVNNNGSEAASMGGVVAHNLGTIVDVTATVELNVKTANTALFAGGVAAYNYGEIKSTSIKGAGIKVADINGAIYVGGIVGSNLGSIESVYNTTEQVGSYNVGKNIKAGGVASVNSGNITKVLSSSNVYGNYAAGVVVEMKTSGTIDQVAIGKYNALNGSLSANTIAGDKYVAGVAVDFRAGTISNVQASSTLEGKASETRTSLIVLVFPRGAKLTNSTINSKVSGYGTFYRDAWVNYDYCSDKSVFGIETSNSSSHFDIYESTSFCGEMTSVVINSNYANGKDVQYSMARVQNIMFVPAGNDYNGTNFVKVVSDFSDFNQFNGSFTFDCAYNDTWNYYETATKTLAFEVGTVWENSNGISLMFLANVK